MTPRVVLLAGALALTGCAGGQPRVDPLPPPSALACWAPGVNAHGEHSGPFACADDGVTPIYSQPISRRTPPSVEVPCPPGHRGPCWMTGSQ